MIDVLPHFQATLNALSLILILAAYIAIRNSNKDLHRKLMISALSVSSVFLVSYLIYHANVGHVPFMGQGAVRYVYFTILIIHILMAALCLIMIIMTVLRAVAGNFDRHKKIARYTFPAWVFVCVSGLVVYVMAFHIYAVAA